MYQVPRITNGINEGDAQILPTNDNSRYFFEMGRGDEYNSSKQKKRRAQARIQKSTEKLDFSKKKDWAPVQIDAFQRRQNEVLSNIESPEYQKQENWEAKAMADLEQLRNEYELTNNAAAEANESFDTYRTKNRSNLSGFDELEEVYNPNWGVSPDTTGKATPLSLKEANTQIQARARNVKEEFEDEYEIPDYQFQSIESPYGSDKTRTVYKPTEEGMKMIKTDAISMVRSGIKQVNGTALLKRPEDVTLLRDVQEYMEVHYGHQLNALESPEEIQDFTEEKAVEYMTLRAKQKHEERIKIANKSQKDDGFSDRDLSMARKVKEEVNQLQDNGDASAINKHLAPYGITAVVTANGVQFTKEKMYADGPVQENVTGVIDRADAEAIYNVISRFDKNVNREALDQIEYRDPTPASSFDKEEDQQYDDVANTVLKAYEEDNVEKAKSLVDELGGKYREDGRDSYVSIGGKEYHLQNKDQASEAYMEIKRLAKQKGVTLEEKSSNTREDLEITEGMTQEDRKFYLKNKQANFDINGESYSIQELIEGGWTIKDIKAKL